MSNSKEQNLSAPKSVAFIITHTIKAGEEKQYENWLTEIRQAASAQPGFISREVFRPAHGGRKYTTLLRFDSLEHLTRWTSSEARKSYIEQVSPLLEKGDQTEIRTGLDFWFTPSGLKPPKPWKQFLLTLSAVYPLGLLIPRLLRLLLNAVPSLDHELLRALLMAVTLTGLLTFVIMPRYTRMVRRWLYEETE
jgi:antibiotic biosynthesis monooxygenase (ABM) superfamily enzyme